MTLKTHLEMTDSSALSALLAHSTQALQQEQLDFSCLDPVTFGVLNDACAQLLQSSTQDADLRLSLVAKNKQLEGKMERLQSDRDRMRGAVQVAQRNEEAAKANYR